MSELMGMGAPATQWSAERPLYRKPVLEEPKDEEPKGDAPEGEKGSADEMPAGMRDAAFREMAKGAEFVKGGTPEGDEEPTAPAAEPPKDEEPPKAAAPPKVAVPAKPPAEKPKAEKPAEKPPEEKPDKEKDAAPARWRIPMDTVFGRTPQSDLERYLKTISATLQAQEGMDIEQASAHIDAVVGEMTKAKLLPPIRSDSSGEEVDAWLDAAMARGLASVILDRA